MKKEKWCVHRLQFGNVLVECCGCGAELLVLVVDNKNLFLVLLLLLPLFLLLLFVLLALVDVEGDGEQPFGAELTLKTRHTSSRTLSCTLIPVMQIFHALQMLV